MFASMRSRVLWGIASIAILFSVGAFWSFSKMEELESRLNQVNELYVPLLKRLKSIEGQHFAFESDLEDRIQFSKWGKESFSFEKPNESESEELKRILTYTYREVLKLKNREEDFLEGVEGQRIFNSFQRLGESFGGYSASVSRLFEKLSNRDFEKAAPVYSEMNDRKNKFKLELQYLERAFDRQVGLLSYLSQEKLRQSSIGLTLISIISLLLCIFLATWIDASLKPLTQLKEKLTMLSGHSSEKKKLQVQEMKVPLNSMPSTEVEFLAAEFNRMLHALDQRDRSLESKRDELSKEISLSQQLVNGLPGGLVVIEKLSDDSPHLIQMKAQASQLIGSDSNKLKEIPGWEEALDKTFKEGGSHRFGLIHLAGKNLELTLRTVVSGKLILGFILDRTEELKLQDQVERTQGLALIGRMGAQVAHEIRNPVNAIGLNAELIEEYLKHIPEKERARMQKILRSLIQEADRLGSITEDYLNLTRSAEVESQRSQIEDVDLRVFISEFLEFHQETFKKAGLQILFQFHEQVEPIRVDRNRLIQVMNNIVQNARESAGPTGKVLVTLGKNKNGEAVIEVCDSGQGISKAREVQLFEPFYTTKPRGTGLGLFLSRQLMEHMGGELRLSAHKGRLGGAEFQLVFHRQKSEEWNHEQRSEQVISNPYRG
jgi:signal transduction histidine kinase